MSAELSDIDAAQLHFLNKLYFKLCSGTPSDKLDSLRGIMRQLQFSKVAGNVSSSAVEILMTKYYSQYAKIMDSRDSVHGVNNYSEEALAQSHLHETECEKWKSQLPLTNLRQIPCLAKFLNKLEHEEDGGDCHSFLDDLQKNWQMGITQSYPNPLVKFETRCLLKEKSVIEHQNVSHRAENNDSDSVMDYQEDAPVAPWTAKSRGWPCTEQKRGPASENLSAKSKGTFGGETSRHLSFKRKQSDCDEGNEDVALPEQTAFRTAKEQLTIDSWKMTAKNLTSISASSYGASKKSLGARKSNVFRRFVPPVLNKTSDEDRRNDIADEDPQHKGTVDEQLKNIEDKMIELIRSEIMDHGPAVRWEDIAGLEFVKKTVMEIIVLPLLRPDIFTGLRGPPKGLLLFGPPGTGKTLIGKCIASNSKSTFFSISASSLTSKWVGEGEKMVRALFAVARCHQPAVIFIDEIDSLLTQRSDSEHESSRRMKTEFLVQLDGATTSDEDKILVVGATNRPQELDEAARRRLVKRLYVPLPDLKARMQIISSMLNLQKHSLTAKHIEDVGIKTDGYSGADMANLCKEAAMGPIRSLSFEDIEAIAVDSVRPITHQDFIDALHQVKASVSPNDLKSYAEWNQQYGSTSRSC